VPANSFALDLSKAILRSMQRRLGLSAQECTQTFNASPRPVQLNLVAQGFVQLGEGSVLSSEAWHSVQDPDLPVDGDDLERTARHFKKRYGDWPRLKTSRLAIVQWGLSDPGS
jgi:hypothetical protein